LELKDEEGMNSISCDVLVVGAGLAGFTAAVRAKETGANVILVDKSGNELGERQRTDGVGQLTCRREEPEK
jgi:succinate dehydrogenase/fumarate reductase flavoprotein subunit